MTDEWQLAFKIVNQDTNFIIKKQEHAFKYSYVCIDSKLYRIESKIGSGGQGKLYKLTDYYGNNYKLKLIRILSEDESAATFAEQEINNLKKLSRYKASFKSTELVECDDGIQREFVTFRIMSKIFIGSDLLKKPVYILANRALIGILTWARIKKLHAAGILHRDVKGDNIILSMHDNLGKVIKSSLEENIFFQKQYFKVRLIDFGLAVECNKKGIYVDKGCAGTYGFVAPSVEHNKTYSFKTDFYAWYKTLEFHLDIPIIGLVEDEISDRMIVFFLFNIIFNELQKHNKSEKQVLNLIKDKLKFSYYALEIFENYKTMRVLHAKIIANLDNMHSKYEDCETTEFSTETSTEISNDTSSISLEKYKDNPILYEQLREFRMRSIDYDRKHMKKNLKKQSQNRNRVRMPCQIL